ncbi:MAG: DNA integrity scanning protein DisA nucleotide-binding domain protein [Methanobacteriota archaeon]
MAREDLGPAPDLSRVGPLLAILEEVHERLGPTLFLLVTDNPEVAEQVVLTRKLPVILASHRHDVQERFAGRVRSVLPLSEAVSGSVWTLTQLKELLMGAYLEGSIQFEDRVVALATNAGALDVLLFFDVRKEAQLQHLRGVLSGRRDVKVLERVLRLAGELALEGREGVPIGTLFLVGDADEVLKRSKQVVLNPFQGYGEKERNILDDSTWETAKEFALIDGAFVIREDGVIEAAGRYIEFQKGVDLQPGLGGRHLAAASITKETKAVAITVSTSGTVRIFKDGRVLVKVDKL